RPRRREFPVRRRGSGPRDGPSQSPPIAPAVRRALAGNPARPANVHVQTIPRNEASMIHLNNRGAAKVSVVWTVVAMVLFLVAIAAFFLNNGQLSETERKLADAKSEKV